MSVADLYQLFYTILEAVDRILEFWISASFAIVVAIFLGAERLNRTMYILVTVAYALITANMVVRTRINAIKLEEVRMRLIEHGEVFVTNLSSAAWALQLAVMALGTFGTLFFVWYMYHQFNRPPGKTPASDA